MNPAVLPATVADLFSTEQTWQTWLDIEAALALSQASLGLIPADHAQRIAACATLRHLDLDALRVDIKRTMAPVLSVVHALAHACGDEAGGYVHWGGTTQNIILGGRVLQMRRVHHLLLARIGAALTTLADLAEDGAGAVMAGRTNRKHALPITFGFKVASWIEELARCVERLRQAEPRTFSLVFGGAIGAMHTFGPDGMQLAETMAKRLGLASPLVHSRAMLDPFCEYVLVLSLFAMACSRIGNELYTLMADEIGEVAETLPDGVVGSSTMPHKDNPKHVVGLIARAARLRALAAPALEAGQPSHEGDSATNQQLYGLIDEACPLAYDVATRLDELLALVRFDPARMRENLARSADVIASERLMMVLAATLGRQHAHDRVHAAIREARREGCQLPEVLLRQPDVARHYTLAQIQEALDPARYTGNSRDIALHAAALARDLARQLAPGQAQAEPLA
ncbi:lyase family protein [Bordetella petrii]|uniref:lyase family protein n=1 Tax=Bordetella petrii TaxID=94624 RepID=UPI001E38076D|nr:lyase family protein [Bordetella petrii]MCD0505433.1 adenylosuccinate lyase family protein [Bordetella petrii]